MIERQVTICADDFGQNQSIDHGILELVQLKDYRLSQFLLNQQVGN